MDKVYLVTSNKGKVLSFNNILRNLDIPLSVEIIDGYYPEDKEKETTAWVALQGAKYCAEKYKKSVLVTDAGIFIDALNGFPGVNTKFTLNRISNEGIIKLLKDVEDRRVTWIFSLGYCELGKDPIEFTSKIDGQVPMEPRGLNGFGFDPIFVPMGHDVTFAEDTNLRDSLSPFKETIIQFVNMRYG